jgi:hypothetical protein
MPDGNESFDLDWCDIAGVSNADGTAGKRRQGWAAYQQKWPDLRG